MEALLASGTRFVLIGGLAVAVHGHVRATKDIDIVPDPSRENLERLAAVLRRLDARQIGVDADLLPHPPTEVDGLVQGGSFQLSTTHGQLDLLQESDVIPRFSALAADSVEVEWRGRVVTVCSRDQLVTMKRRAGRAIDLADLEALEIAHGG